MFSVLMSIYKNDDATFLSLALESIYEKQTLKPDEIVIVFDGELTYELYKVVDEFICDKQDIVKLVKLDRNHGLGEALRIGSEYCTSDYIMRMDSDDISDSNRFEIQMNYIEKNPNVDVLGCNIAEFNNSINEEMRIRSVPTHHNDIVKMAKKRNPMNHVTVCIKKSALVKCGGYETLLLLEDYYLWLKMIVAGCVLANINQNLVYVRVGNGFNSKRGSKTRIAGWRVLQNYMLKNRLINQTEALINMLYIRVFIYMPGNVRSFIYKNLLRN